LDQAAVIVAQDGRRHSCNTQVTTVHLCLPHRASTALAHYRANVAEFDKRPRVPVRQRAETAGLRDPDSFARSWHILI
jgi:hypothetical protein